jgi:hypothetical protein
VSVLQLLQTRFRFRFGAMKDLDLHFPDGSGFS